MSTFETTGPGSNSPARTPAASPTSPLRRFLAPTRLEGSGLPLPPAVFLRWAADVELEVLAATRPHVGPGAVSARLDVSASKDGTLRARAFDVRDSTWRRRAAGGQATSIFLAAVAAFLTRFLTLRRWDDGSGFEVPRRQ